MEPSLFVLLWTKKFLPVNMDRGRRRRRVHFTPNGRLSKYKKEQKIQSYNEFCRERSRSSSPRQTTGVSSGKGFRCRRPNSCTSSPWSHSTDPKDQTRTWVFRVSRGFVQESYPLPSSTFRTTDRRSLPQKFCGTRTRTLGTPNTTTEKGDPFTLYEFRE